MDKHTISIEIPSDILLALNESESDFKIRIKVNLAVQLYRLNKLTIGKAALLAGLSRFEFESVLSGHKIPISNLTLNDILEDIKKIK